MYNDNSTCLLAQALPVYLKCSNNEYIAWKSSHIIDTLANNFGLLLCIVEYQKSLINYEYTIGWQIQLIGRKLEWSASCQVLTSMAPYLDELRISISSFQITNINLIPVFATCSIILLTSSCTFFQWYLLPSWALSTC